LAAKPSPPFKPTESKEEGQIMTGFIRGPSVLESKKKKKNYRNLIRTGRERRVVTVMRAKSGTREKRAISN